MAPHRGELLATDPAAIVEHLAAAAGGHAGAEAVLALTADLRGLILAFHRLKLALKMAWRSTPRRSPPQAERGG